MKSKLLVQVAGLLVQAAALPIDQRDQALELYPDGFLDKRGFFANLFDDLFGGSETTQAAAQMVTQTIAQVQPVATQASSPAPSAAAGAGPSNSQAVQQSNEGPSSQKSGSSGGFFDSLFSGLNSWFDLDSPSSTTTASTAPQSPAVNTASYQADSSPASSGSQSQGYSSSPASSTGSPSGAYGGKAGSGYGGTGGNGPASGSGGYVATKAGDTPGWFSMSGSQQSSVPTGQTEGGQNAQYAEGAKGMSYSPYSKSGSCKSSDEVAADIKRLQGYDIIRLYSTDCSGIENVLAAMSSHQQIFAGIWNLDTNSVQSGLSDIQKAVQGSSRGWSAIHTIAIGNERVNEGQATVNDISSAISTARNWLKANAADYSGAVVSVDTLVAVKNNPGLCGLSDYIAVNCHPYWDGGVQPENAGPWLKQQINELAGICNNNKQIMITETGWPTEGGEYGQCVPSVENQKIALQSIIPSLGSDVIAFTMYNDYWKSGGTNGVEQYWGVFGDPMA